MGKEEQSFLMEPDGKQVTVSSVENAIREVRKPGPLNIYIDENLSNEPIRRATDRLRGLTRLRPINLFRR